MTFFRDPKSKASRLEHMLTKKTNTTLKEVIDVIVAELYQTPPIADLGK
jgi:hypothetical protein